MPPRNCHRTSGCISVSLLIRRYTRTSNPEETMIKPMARCAALLLAVTLSLTAVARAETPAEFYKGKDVRMLISHPPGGGYDIYARLFARHLTRFLDGHPNVIPQNMPGAAGIVMANSMAAQQPSDG